MIEIHAKGKSSGTNVNVHDKFLMQTRGILNKINDEWDSIIQTLGGATFDVADVLSSYADGCMDMHRPSLEKT